ncbi:hypothetical protein [Desulfosporosinus sp. Sb-LF]|uniref:alpha/beta hydrolase family protein n=1 Tax=Desulfosporosinus sp. Sb-LF TaxID=2560027 RepID=UPI00107F6EED|nr:hypothetical protein [Desulfosporosinus sp. Sb-LF]TGE31089.1 hypothetical protein E4K68_19185 [Desulfosporosinus sp. Sb-LF]
MICRKSVLKLLLSLIVIGLIFISLLLGYFVVERNKTVVLPKPTGSFAVGRIGYDWVDGSRNERKLSIWIWYPTDLNQNAKKADYFPNKWEIAQERDSGITSYLQQNFGTVKNNSYQDMPLSTKQTNYPVIVFEPGMGNIVFNYTALLENLASRGYTVVGINPTYSSRYVVFSDGSVAYRTPEGSMPESNPTDKQLNEVGAKLIKTWTEDMSFVFNKLGEINAKQGSMWTGHIDMAHLGAFGHSFGGDASANACLVDNRIKAGIDIDGYLYGVEKVPEKPFMFILSEHQKNTIDLQEYHKIREDFNGLKNDGYLLEVSKASHFNFLDNAIFFSPILKYTGVFGAINGERGLQVTNSYITAFFDKYLKNIDSNLLKQKSSDYPEIKIQIKK